MKELNDSVKQALFPDKTHGSCEDITFTFKTEPDVLDEKGNVLSTTEKTIVVKEFNLDEWEEQSNKVEHMENATFAKYAINVVLDRKIGGSLTSTEFEAMRPREKLKIANYILNNLLSLEDTKSELIKKK